MTRLANLKIEAKASNLALVLKFVSENVTFTKTNAQKHVELAVEEVFINIANYAYHPETGPVSVSLTIVDDVVYIEFSDVGVPFNPLLESDPDTSLPSGQRRVGGLGIYMLKQLVDNVAYRREGDVNILTISKEVT